MIIILHVHVDLPVLHITGILNMYMLVPKCALSQFGISVCALGFIYPSSETGIPDTISVRKLRSIDK